MRRNRFGELTDDSPERDLDPITDVEECLEAEEVDSGTLRRTEEIRLGGFQPSVQKRSESGEPLSERTERLEAESREEKTPERTDGVAKREASETPFLRTGEPVEFDRAETRKVERSLEVGDVFTACDGEDGYQLEALGNWEPANGSRYRAKRVFRVIEENGEGESRAHYRTALPLAELIELGVLERLNGNGTGGEGTDG